MDHTLVRALLDRDLRVGQQPRQLDEQAAGHNDGALAFDARLERPLLAQPPLAVAPSESQTGGQLVIDRISES